MRKVFLIDYKLQNDLKYKINYVRRDIEQSKNVVRTLNAIFKINRRNYILTNQVSIVSYTHRLGPIIMTLGQPKGGEIKEM